MRARRRLGLRRPGPGRLTRAALALVAAWVGSASCDAPAELQPDAELQRTYGLTPRDRVHVVALSHRPPGEAAEPVEAVVRVGDWVVFQSADGFGRRVHFELDSLSVEARTWITERDVEASPPLLSVGVRWVISFEAAPPGRYPYRIEGNRQSGRGALRVDAGSRFPFYTP